MCKWSKWGDTRIDPCMRNLVKFIEDLTNWKPVMCCCGHGKYNPTLLLEHKSLKTDSYLELFSGKFLLKKRKMYKRDEKEHYYIPEINN